MVAKRVLWVPALAAVCALAIAGCSNSDSGTGNTGGTGGAAGTIVVTVGAGMTPTYTWTGGDLMAVSVARTSDRGNPVWGVVANPPADAVASGVTHGNVPAGAIATFTAEPVLTAGVEYSVSVAKIDGSTFGFTDFTP